MIFPLSIVTILKVNTQEIYEHSWNWRFRLGAKPIFVTFEGEKILSQMSAWKSLGVILLMWKICFLDHSKKFCDWSFDIFTMHWLYFSSAEGFLIITQPKPQPNTLGFIFRANLTFLKQLWAFAIFVFYQGKENSAPALAWSIFLLIKNWFKIEISIHSKW